jgi:hypothetical protein
MNKLLLYKILFVANISISILIIVFIIAFNPIGKTLFVLVTMTILACLCALALYMEIRK